MCYVFAANIVCTDSVCTECVYVLCVRIVCTDCVYRLYVQIMFTYCVYGLCVRIGSQGGWRFGQGYAIK